MMPLKTSNLPMEDPPSSSKNALGANNMPPQTLHTSTVVAPDGGFWAWMSVLSGFFIVMNTWGVFTSFGVFQLYFTTTLGRSSSDVAWIGSFEVFLLFLMGSVAGALTDAGHFRGTMTAGCFFILLGTFASSVSTTYWQLFLAQGVCCGLGNGLVFTPAMAVISTYFTAKRALALAIAACGSTVGGLVFPSIARTLMPTIGFGWTTRIIGLLQLITLTLSLATIRPRKFVKSTTKPLIDWSAFRAFEYTLYAFGSFLAYIGVFFPFFFLGSYARNVQGLTYRDSLNLILVLNGAGIIGRLFPSITALKMGPLNVYIAHVASTAIAMYAWSGVTSTAGLYVWTVFFSLCMGGVQSLGPSALASVIFDLEKQGTLLGMVFTVIGFGALIGPPLSGVLVGGKGGYLGAEIFAGSCMIIGFVVLIAAREVKRRKEHMGFWTKI